MSRRRHSQAAPASLDSFLDIMTNVIGVLVLIAMVLVIHSSNLEITLGTPKLHNPHEGATRHLLHCAQGRVAQIELAALREAGKEIYEEAVRGHEHFAVASEAELTVRVAFERNDVGTANHRLDLYLPGRTDITLREGAGESRARLKKRSSDFRKLLAGLDPEKDWLFFMVEDDSFGTFRSARQIAREAGIEVGWYPQESDRPISFRTGGGAGGQAQ